MLPLFDLPWLPNLPLSDLVQTAFPWGGLCGGPRDAISPSDLGTLEDSLPEFINELAGQDDTPVAAQGPVTRSQTRASSKKPVTRSKKRASTRDSKSKVEETASIARKRPVTRAVTRARASVSDPKSLKLSKSKAEEKMRTTPPTQWMGSPSTAMRLSPQSHPQAAASPTPPLQTNEPDHAAMQKRHKLAMAAVALAAAAAASVAAKSN